MRHGDGTFGDGAAGEEPRVVVRDKRRIDPVTGEVRVPPAGEQPAGGGVHVDKRDSEVAAAAVSAQEAELAALQAQLDERTGDLQRISAEYSNYRRRVERDRQLVIDTAKAQVVTQLLTVLDDIERAQEHGDLSGAFKDVADKVVLVDWQVQALWPYHLGLVLGLRGAKAMIVVAREGGPYYQASGALGTFDGIWHAEAPPCVTMRREDAAKLATGLEVRVVLRAPLNGVPETTPV